jgi:hypothetical protein
VFHFGIWNNRQIPGLSNPSMTMDLWTDGSTDVAERTVPITIVAARTDEQEEGVLLKCGNRPCTVSEFCDETSGALVGEYSRLENIVGSTVVVKLKWQNHPQQRLCCHVLKRTKGSRDLGRRGFGLGPGFIRLDYNHDR